MLGLFIIATGKQYVDYSKYLVSDVIKYIMLDTSIYVLTDSPTPIEGARTVPCEKRPWPEPTLMRYHYILRACEQLKIKHQYYYYLDADMRVVEPIGREILGKHVATIHPGFAMKSPDKFIVDPKFLAQSYVNPHKLKNYFAGGFQGGSNFLKAASQIKEWVDIDRKYGHTPIYHDESYWNKYCVLNPPDKILDPSYCMPETERERKVYQITNYKPKIIAITKHEITR